MLTDTRSHGHTDGRTHPLIEMRRHIYKVTEELRYFIVEQNPNLRIHDKITLHGLNNKSFSEVLVNQQFLE